MKTCWQRIIAVGGLLVASTAGAQVVDGRGNPYRQWDVAAGGTLHVDREPLTGGDDRLNQHWDGAVAVHVEAGRYWNSHVKTEVSVAALTGRRIVWWEPVAIPEGITTAYHDTDIARTQIGAALTYQFFENVFAQPYVSAGVRATLHDNHTVRRASGTPASRLEPLERRELAVLRRPYVAAGLKSYVTERSFIRSELSTAYADEGISQWTLRLGVGVDF